MRFGRDAAAPPLPRHPALLRAFAGELQAPEWAGGQLEALIFDAHGGPWLQALLTALAPDRRALPSVVSLHCLLRTVCPVSDRHHAAAWWHGGVLCPFSPIPALRAPGGARASDPAGA